MKNSITLLITTILLLAANSVSAAQVITFKGIPLDKPGVKDALIQMCEEHQSSNKYAVNDDCKNEINGGKAIYVNYGTLSNAVTVFKVDSEGTLLRVKMSVVEKGELYGLVEVLTDKYGKPKKTSTQAETRNGNKHDKDIFVWVGKNGTRITVETIYRDINTGRFLMESSSTVHVDAVKEKLLHEAGKNNL